MAIKKKSRKAPSFNEAQIPKAVRALKTANNSESTKNAEASKDGKESLFPSTDHFCLQITFQSLRIKGRLTPYKIPLPHPIYNENDDVVVIVKEKSAEMGRKPEKYGFKGGIRFVDMSELKTDFFCAKSKQRLRDSAELFLADKNIVDRLPALLGKTFIKRRKMPLRVNLNDKKFEKDLRSAISSSPLFLSGNLTCQLKIAKIDFPEEKVVENARAAISYIADKFGEKWGNVQCICIKTTSSESLPLYRCKPSRTKRLERGVLDVLDKNSHAVERIIQDYMGENSSEADKD